MKRILIFALTLFTTTGFSQTITDNYFKLTRANFNQQNAYETTAFVEKYFRVPGNTGFNASIHYVEDILKKAGYIAEKANEFEAPLTYRIEKRPMKRNTWEPVDASVIIVGETMPLIAYKTNRNMIPINCPSTPKDGITAEVVFVGKGTPADFEGKDLKGKIVFGDVATGRLISAAVKAGAIGAMGYSLPKYNQPEIHQTSISFGSMPANAGIWSLLLSYGVKEKLKAACLKGKVELKVNIETKIYQAEELTIVANVKGSIKPNERFVYSAHVQEPGANDNATGVGTLAEMARVTATLIKSGKLNPQRTLTFLWGDEIVSTGRYITDDKERAKGILWGMSLDMVGEDTKKTGGSFLIEKMPDPSAIWTRGTDKHSEWGAGDVKEKDLFPHYYNDFIMNICKTQGKFANWTVNFNPFEGGSDHTPFLRNQIPGLLMWHFTDVFYHTDNDRIDKVSATTMKNVGVSALTAAYTLITADENTASATVNQVKNDALIRLKTEFELSKKAIAEGKSLTDEKHIIEVWGKYYVDALATINTMAVEPKTTRVGSTIKVATLAVEKQTQIFLDELKNISNNSSAN
ncbi:M28 family peptidase [Pedobacter cryotolerans]|uniref:M28 family peptidase n=1 Tax=Pedobacter cryotolerans TaxID=2571270 RepID=A0A4U1BYD4_9SPHI|nr:M28 family peptidase [Pedobacter cryotolerans]TKB98041.1 M28 family peptidase [Pedobacter cryotolerans]